MRTDGIWEAAVGGTVLGLTTTAMLAATGKLIGLSGIFEGALSIKNRPGWKVLFLSGFTVGGVVAGVLFPEGMDQTGAPPISAVGFSISGVLVGLGTRLGRGCTSGHGLCGLSRLSRRSIIATMTFLTSGVAAASVISARLGDNSRIAAGTQELPSMAVRYVLLAAAAIGVALTLRKKEELADWKTHLTSFVCGGVFSSGLVVSGMVQRAKVVDFLALRSDTWNPALAFVMGCGVLTIMPGFALVTRRLGAPLFSRPVTVSRSGRDTDSVVAASEETPAKFEIPTNTTLDIPLILGGWLFGIGWGSVGLCPGPAFVAAAFGLPSPALIFLPSVIAGMKFAGPLENVVSLPHPGWIAGRGASDGKDTWSGVCGGVDPCFSHDGYGSTMADSTAAPPRASASAASTAETGSSSPRG